MSYGSSSWQPWVLDEDASIEQIHLAYQLGINTFDTADAYSNGASEIVLGKAIKKFNLPRDELVVMTKVFLTVGRDVSEGFVVGPNEELYKRRYTNQQGLSRKVRLPSSILDRYLIPLQHIFDAVKHSLERLQLDYIDVLQCESFPRRRVIRANGHPQAIALIPIRRSKRRCRLYTTSSRRATCDILE